MRRYRIFAGRHFAVVALASPAFAQTGGTARRPPTRPTSRAAAHETTTRSSSPRPSARRRSRTCPSRSTRRPQADIQRANAQTIEDISRNVAGLTVQNLGPGQSQVSVRGVSAGQIVRDQPGVKEQVGIYLDESVISLSLFTPDFDLFDLNRVETLRGPQGTLFGSGVGRRHDPLHHQPAQARHDGGPGRSQRQHLNGGDIGYQPEGRGQRAARRRPRPFAPSATARIRRASSMRSDRPAGKNINDGSRVGGRVSLLLEPTPELKITPRVVYQEVRGRRLQPRGTLQPLRQPVHDDRRRPDRRAQAISEASARSSATRPLLADLTASYDFGGVELTSVSSYMHRDILVSRDASALTGSVYVSFAGAAPRRPAVLRWPSNLRDTTKLKQFTQELRLASTGAGPFQWVFGGFYSQVDRKYAQRLPTPGLGRIRPGLPRRRRTGTPDLGDLQRLPGRQPLQRRPAVRTSSRRRCSARRATTSVSSS